MVLKLQKHQICIAKSNNHAEEAKGLLKEQQKATNMLSIAVLQKNIYWYAAFLPISYPFNFFSQLLYNGNTHPE